MAVQIPTLYFLSDSAWTILDIDDILDANNDHISIWIDCSFDREVTDWLVELCHSTGGYSVLLIPYERMRLSSPEKFGDQSIWVIANNDEDIKHPFVQAALFEKKGVLEIEPGDTFEALKQVMERKDDEQQCEQQ